MKEAFNVNEIFSDEFRQLTFYICKHTAQACASETVGPFTNTLSMRKNPPFSKSLKLQKKTVELIKL